MLYTDKVDRIEVDSIGVIYFYSTTQEILDSSGKFIKNNNKLQAYSKKHIIKDLDTTKIKANLNF